MISDLLLFLHSADINVVNGDVILVLFVMVVISVVLKCCVVFRFVSRETFPSRR